MGKRELVLIAVFVVLGVATWQLTRPPAEPGATGFSVSRILDRMRAEMRGERVAGDVRASARAPRPGGVTLVALEGFSGTTLVIGEARDDVTAEVRGTIFGADEAQAGERARAVALDLRPETERLVLAVKVPETNRRARLELELRVPRQLAVSLKNVRGRLEVRGVAGADLDTRGGDLTVADVAGVVKGLHRSGRIEMSRVGACAFESRMGDVRVSDVAGTLTWTADGGSIEIGDVAGATTLKVQRGDVELERLGAEVSVEAKDGRVDLRDVRHPVTYEGDDARLVLVLDAPVAGNVRVAGASVNLTIPREPLSLDLEAEEGTLRLPTDFPKASETDRRQSLKVDGGAGAPTLVVRTRRDGITVTRRP
jgi:hypothetical protein